MEKKRTRKINKSKQISVKLSCASFNRSEQQRETCETWSCEVQFYFECCSCSWTWTYRIRLILQRKNVTNIKRVHKLPTFTSVMLEFLLVAGSVTKRQGETKFEINLLLCIWEEWKKEQICIFRVIFGCCETCDHKSDE